jgi:cytochrome c oxidase subunit 1
MDAIATSRRPLFRRPSATSGLASWLTTVDHKRIGILYGVTAFIFFLLGGIEALLLRVQLAQANGTFLDAETYDQVFTMHGLTMIFLVVMPLSAAFFNYLIPLMIGARDVAFPRLNAFSYWVFLLGGVFLYSSFFLGEAPNGGWFGYPPQTDVPFSPGIGMDFYAIGLQILGVASLASAVNFIVTILNERAPGMTLMRMPVFVWMTLVVSFLLLFAMPVIAIALFELGFDRLFGAVFFKPSAGGDPLLWQHLFCRRWGSCPRCCRPSAASRCSGTPRWCSPGSPSASWAGGCGPITCSRWASGPSPTPRSPCRRCSSPCRPA